MKAIPSAEALQLLPHRNYNQAQLILCAGKRGYGKTWFIERYIDTRESRVFLFDPFEDFSKVRRRIHWEDALEDMALAGDGPCRRRVVPPITSDSREYADDFFEAAAEQLHNCLFVLDEISLWSGPRESTQLRTLILQGRRLGIRIMAACQRVALVPSVMLSECTDMVVFRTNRPLDLETLEDWMGDNSSKIAPKLQIGECLVKAL